MNLLPYLLMLSLINSCIELEISVPSFPSIMTYFNVSQSIVGLTITMNLIGFCIAAIIYGPLSDSYGRRKIMLLGNSILVIGSTLCVLAPTMQILLLARLIQGLGAATSAVVVCAIIADSYKTQQASRLYAIMNAVFTSLMAAAPVLGGLINAAIGWRGNYGLVAGICIISWILLLIFLPETLKKKKQINLKGILQDYKILITSPKFIIAATVPSLLYGCYMAFVAISPFIYMQTMGLDMLIYTINTSFIVACFALASFFSSQITDLLGVRKTLIFALVMQLIGTILMCFARKPIHLTSSMSIFSIGFALIYPIIFARSMEIFPEVKGAASSAIMSLRYLICAGLTFLSSYAFDGSILSIGLILLITSTIIITLGLLFMSKMEFFRT